MYGYSPAHVAQLLGVSADTVRRWCDQGRLAWSGPEAGPRLVDGATLATYLRSTYAEHGPTQPVSARNQFEGIVTRIERDTVMAQVELCAPPHRIVSLMSREAADELRLEPGAWATASIKATNVVVSLRAKP
jgi:molybdopterin-binding protein